MTTPAHTGDLVPPGGTADQVLTKMSGLDGDTAWGDAPSGASALTVKDEGSALSTAADTLDFVGAGVAASGTGATKTITIPGSSAVPGLNLAPTAVKTGNYTAAASDLVLCDTSGGAFAVTLPSAPANLTTIAVELVTAGNTLTINRGGTDHFDTTSGATAVTVNTALHALLFQYTASTGVWTRFDHLPAIINTKGDLLTYSTTRARLPVGTNGQTLVADSTQTPGIKWAPPSTVVWIPVLAFFSPNLATRDAIDTTNKRTPAWLFPDAATNSIITALHVPDEWSTFAVDLECANAGAGSGNVTIEVRPRFTTAADDMSTVGSVLGAATAYTAGAQNIQTLISQAGGANITNSPGKLLTLRVGRLGADAGDTLTNDFGVVQVGLRRVT